MEQHIFDQLSRRLRPPPVTPTVSHLDKAWRNAYQALLKFAEQEGHLQIPAALAVDGVPLSKWQGNQISRYHNRTLSHEKTRLLERIPGWSWSGGEGEAWDKHYAALLAFTSREGHALIPLDHLEGQLQLGTWVKVQRRLYAQGSLNREKQERLEKLPGWEWGVASKPAEPSKASLEKSTVAPKKITRDEVSRRPALEDFRPADHRLAEKNLRPAVRLIDNPQPSRVDPPIVEPVEQVRQAGGSIGDKAKQDSRLSKSWMQAFAALLKFSGREGHAAVPPNHVEDGFQLSDWVMVQRYAFLRGELQSHKIEHLERVSGWTWDIHTTGENKKIVSSWVVNSPHEEGEDDLLRWEIFYPQLVEFVQRERHSRIEASSLPEFGPLTKWAEEIRGRHRRGRLLPKRVKQLECLEGWSWKSTIVDDDEGQTSLEARVGERESVRKTGGCILGNSQPRTWVAEQKRAYKNGDLTAVKRRKLESMPGFFSEREKECLWHETFEHLWFFVRKEKHAQVPQDYVVEGVPLGEWVAEQRRLHRSKELNEPRRRKLEALSPWTWKPEPVGLQDELQKR